MKREGLILILSAPSGAGKTSLCRELFKTFPDIRESISYTTRKPRPGEVDGEAYHFVSQEEFERMVDEDAFAEWALVHGNMYGTALKTLEEARKNGVNLVLDIDCQGALKLKEQFDGGIYVFILPPSMEELRRRLESRSSDAQDVIERRILRAADEIKESRWYDYIIINDNFEVACSELSAIVIAHCRKTFRMMEQVGKLFDI
ncbi:MAG: guanylate kinase [Geobacteraceae bacterium GWC2_55_20]|nr:guanylate kinase [Deltaproteobacteria bacterium]OGU04870.1 MAG: guanylate kinase [Geobacteraceae bacterium GWC2_55_20]OGU26573.1 MAG: guanylate kinase [Geobacteraceae bacterium GWF2_54_21]HBA71795.1 guanylate kinase [Geobacter sp.]HCE66172.1 guanylate kinase [Geobacter sp.]